VKVVDVLGVLGAAIAGFLWFLSRWTHELLRCLRGAEAGGREVDVCVSLLEWPLWVFHLWLLLAALSAGWGVFLVVRGRRAWGGAAVIVALGVFIIAGSFM
jgi:hypothetical protein